MRKMLDRFYKNHSLIYKYILYLSCVFCIVFFFPRGGKFKYEYQKGKPWQHENLYAPFDFSILKSEAEIEEEKARIGEDQINYYRYDTGIADIVREEFQDKIAALFDSNRLGNAQQKNLETLARELLNEFYTYGVIKQGEPGKSGESIYLVKNNEAKTIGFNRLFEVQEVAPRIRKVLEEKGLNRFNPVFQELFFDLISPNVFYDLDLSEKSLDERLSEISMTRGTVDEGKLIIAKGEVVELENLQLLDSLKTEYESELWSTKNLYFILSGYSILVALVLMMLFLFLKKYRPAIFGNNTKVTFIFFNILLMVLLTTFVIKYNEALVFVVPLCILPLILKTFFDARLGLFAHVLTVFLLGFVVPNGFEYVFLQIIAGIVTILTVSELYKRANLFISVAQITFIYISGYLAFHMIHEGSFENIAWFTLGLFLLNGMITLFVQPLIYIYEKIFGLISDVSLLELSDTNSKLLKELSDKAPGTFHHSLQVANLSEAAANEIGANAMLVRVGALYHDIGKMSNPTYFTENQVTNVNPHADLSPKESARIIIAHVIAGIELARKRNLPDRIIDFIRSHHGTTMVYYFFKKQQESGEGVDEADFRYPGPAPFSRETAILMMADSVEAASKSLQNPSYAALNAFVDKIIAGQMQANQFLNADITFKEIETVKKVFKQKLTNIYHLRVEYPE
ncbi:MAG: HDIG domain-containing metalloprotein [Bacteroidota bacterium]